MVPQFPAFSPLQIQRNSLQSYGFGNDQQGLYALSQPANILAVQGTAFDQVTGYNSLLIPNNHSPRGVDIYPIFNTGVPTLLRTNWQQAKTETHWLQVNHLLITFYQ